MTRGRLLVAASMAVAAMVAAATGVALFTAGVEGPGEGWEAAGTLNDLQQRSPTLVDRQYWLVAEDDQVVALSNRDPHLGERITFCASSSWFEDELHGSAWDRWGNYAQGPTPRGMDRYDTQVIDGEVWVQSDVLVDGPPRGTTEPESPSGPFCR